MKMYRAMGAQPLTPRLRFDEGLVRLRCRITDPNKTEGPVSRPCCEVVTATAEPAAPRAVRPAAGLDPDAIEHAAAARIRVGGAGRRSERRRRGAGTEDRGRLAVNAGHDRQHAGWSRKKRPRGYAVVRVSTLAVPRVRHEAAAAAHAEPAAFGALQQHERRSCASTIMQMDDDQNGLHRQNLVAAAQGRALDCRRYGNRRGVCTRSAASAPNYRERQLGLQPCGDFSPPA